VKLKDNGTLYVASISLKAVQKHYRQNSQRLKC